MSQAESLLNNASARNSSLMTTNPSTGEHIVVGKDRVITVPDSLKRIAVQYDHNIETVTFDCPRYWDGNDLSEMYIYINYSRSDRIKGSYLVKNIVIDETDTNIIHFDWTIGNEVTFANGSLMFLICALKTDSEGNEERHWNSEINSEMYITDGLECNEAVIDGYPDIITDLLTRMDTMLSANTPILDTSLTQSGLAADAKSVGDVVKKIVNGGPLTANSIDEMTDVSKIYVNTTDGNWYYYNDKQWKVGGVYQATGIAPQSISRGELLTEKYTRPTWEQGSIVDNVDADNETRIRSNFTCVKKGSKIIFPNNCNFSALECVYPKQGIDNVITRTVGWSSGEYIVINDCWIRFIVKYSNDAAITPSEGENIISYLVEKECDTQAKGFAYKNNHNYNNENLIEQENRASLSEFLVLKGGSAIYTNHNYAKKNAGNTFDFGLSVCDMDGNFITTCGWTLNAIYTLPSDKDYYKVGVSFKKSNNSEFTEDELKDYLENLYFSGFELYRTIDNKMSSIPQQSISRGELLTENYTSPIWEQGTLYNNEESESNKRIRSQYMYVKKGSKLIFNGGTYYTAIESKFPSQGLNDVIVKTNDWLTGEYVIKNDCWFRCVVRKIDDTNISVDESNKIVCYLVEKELTKASEFTYKNGHNYNRGNLVIHEARASLGIFLILKGGSIILKDRNFSKNNNLNFGAMICDMDGKFITSSGWLAEGYYALPTDEEYYRVGISFKKPDNSIFADSELKELVENIYMTGYDDAKTLFVKDELIPKYWENYLTNKMSAIRNKDLTIGNHGDTFFFITDVHWTMNVGRSLDLIKWLSNNCNAENVFLGGDIACANETTVDVILKEVDPFLRKVRELDLNCHMSIGNHDTNNNCLDYAGYNNEHALSPSQLYALYMQQNKQNTEYYYYVDNDLMKIRYIIVNNSLPGIFDDTQKSWLRNAISELSNEWTVIVFAHRFFLYSETSEYGQEIMNELDSVYNSGPIIAGLIVGHNHRDVSITSTKGYPIISSCCDAYDAEHEEEMVVGTPTEQCFDIVHIDKVSRKLYFTRIGAGNDREFNY